MLKFHVVLTPLKQRPTYLYIAYQNQNQLKGPLLFIFNTISFARFVFFQNNKLLRITNKDSKQAQQASPSSTGITFFFFFFIK